MGFCTAKHIDLLNMTNWRRPASAKGAKNAMRMPPGSGGETGPFHGRRRTAQLSQAWGAKR